MPDDDKTQEPEDKGQEVDEKDELDEQDNLFSEHFADASKNKKPVKDDEGKSTTEEGEEEGGKGDYWTPPAHCPAQPGQQSGFYR